ncbi:hypothetical protein D3C86_2032100 [compost metagenome]
MSAAKTQRRIYTNKTFGCGAAAANQLLYLINLGKNARDMCVIELSLGSQTHGSGGAVD